MTFESQSETVQNNVSRNSRARANKSPVLLRKSNQYFFQLMKYCSRSTEEIFGLFICIAFCVDALKFLIHEFDVSCRLISGIRLFKLIYSTFGTVVISQLTLWYFQDKFCFSESTLDCDSTKPLVSVILVFGTVFIGTQIYNFRYR